MFLEPRQHFDNAIIGVMRLPSNAQEFVLYDREKVLNILTEHQGLESREDAEEWYQYNIIQAWFGGNTPAYASIGEDKEFALEMLEEEVEPGMEDRAIGAYERFGGVEGVVYDAFLLNDEQKTRLAYVDTTENALLRFEGIDPAPRKGPAL